jgi:hypothetical protein
MEVTKTGMAASGASCVPIDRRQASLDVRKMAQEQCTISLSLYRLSTEAAAIKTARRAASR